MKILAIDPGYERCGVAVIEGERSRPTLLFSTCLRTSAKDGFHARLAFIGTEVRRIIDTHSPDLFAIEKLYFNTNQKTAMNVAEVRGALLYIALSHHVPVSEFTPLQIKQAIAGHGHAEKKQIMAMLPKLIEMPQQDNALKLLDDEYDAIAIGVTALAYGANNVVK